MRTAWMPSLQMKGRDTMYRVRYGIASLTFHRAGCETLREEAFKEEEYHDNGNTDNQ